MGLAEYDGEADGRSGTGAINMRLVKNRLNGHAIEINISPDGSVKFVCDSGLCGAICSNCQEMVETLFAGFVLGLKLP